MYTEQQNSSIVEIAAIVANPNTPLRDLLAAVPDEAQREAFRTQFQELEKIETGLLRDMQNGLEAAKTASTVTEQSSAAEKTETVDGITLPREVLYPIVAALGFLLSESLNNTEMTNSDWLLLILGITYALSLALKDTRFRKLSMEMEAVLAENQSLKESVTNLPSTSDTVSEIMMQKNRLLTEIRNAIQAAQSAQE